MKCFALFFVAKTIAQLTENEFLRELKSISGKRRESQLNTRLTKAEFSLYIIDCCVFTVLTP